MFVREIRELKRKPRRDEALKMLHKVEAMVRPIMKKEGLKVGTLTEFFPKNPNLLGLNVNHGMKICVRLRPSHDDSSFYPFEHVVGTMLHELVHNKIGPHDQKFYKYLDELSDQFYKLVDSGFSGDGFVGSGQVLGSRGLGTFRGRGGALSEADRRKRAADEAIRRTQLGLNREGQRLGGTSGGLAKPLAKPLAVLVREAAERRQRDAKWCASESIDLTNDLDELGLEDTPTPGPGPFASGPSGLSASRPSGPSVLPVGANRGIGQDEVGKREGDEIVEVRVKRHKGKGKGNASNGATNGAAGTATGASMKNESEVIVISDSE